MATLAQVADRLERAENYYNLLRVRYNNGNPSVSRSRLDSARDEVERLRSIKKRLLMNLK